MVTMTLARGSTSVDIPVIETGGTPVFSTQYGKPFANVRSGGGSINPRAQDNWSAQINHSLVGRFYTDAYTRAVTLAELIQGDNDGNDLELTTNLSEFDDPLLVSPQAGNAQALTLTYPPGHESTVFIDLGLTQVGSITGSPSRGISTPTASGSGPIELRAGGETVQISVDVQLERSVGRPNDSATKTPNGLGRYIYKHKVTSDVHTLSFEFTENTITNLKTITDKIFKQQLGRDGLVLDYNGLYGLGEFRVLPTGSAPVRYNRLAGREGQVTVPTMEFRVITV